MADTSGGGLDWQALAAAIPGATAVQSDGAFVHVSPAFAATVGVDAADLVGESWRTLFDPAAAERLERTAAGTASPDGRWEGTVRTGGGAVDAVDVQLTLSPVDDDAVLWLVEEADRDSDDGGLPDRRPFRDHPALGRTLLDAVDDVVYVIDEDGRMYFCNETLAERTGYDREEIYGMAPKRLIPEDHHEYVPGLMEAIRAIDDRRVDVDILTRDGERLTHEFQGTTFEDPVTGEAYRCGFARDVTEQRRRERDRRRRLDELATLKRINEILLETVREMVDTSSLNAVEALVCERLAESGLYESAWIGERSLDGDGIVDRASAGDGPGGPDAAVPGECTDAGALAAAAVEAGAVRVASDGDAAGERQGGKVGRSVAAVPVSHEGTVEGALVVATDREDAFGDHERSALGVLGRTIGFVGQAARREELLLADEVVELEFQLDGGRGPLFDVASALGCTFTLEGYVTAGDDWVLYLAVDGAPRDAVVDALSSADRIERARLLWDDRLEVTLSSPLLDAVVETGAAIGAASVGPRTSRLVVEAPPAADVRDVVGALRRQVPEAEFVARRDRERATTTADRPEGPLGDATDRQRETLEAAYRAGYFAWPRESTAEEVAATLDLDPSTLHGHLRKGEATILAALFDGD